MQDKKFDTAQRLLLMNPEEQEQDIDLENSHTQENLIPPVGIAHPDIVESFMENLDDEEKIKKDIEDVENYYKENPLQTAEREVKSYGLRALEGLGGGIGSLLNALSGEVYFNDNGELANHEVPMLPSTSELREFTKEKTGKKYEPKTKTAKEFHEAATDIGSAIALPGGWAAKLLFPIMGQGVKALAKHQGATEKEADLTKLGFMMTATLANIGNAPRMARNAYNEAVNMIPQGTRIPTRYLSQEITALRNRPWFRTGRTTSKGPAMDELNRIEDSIQHGSMDAHNAMQIRRDINEARKKLGAFNYEPGIDKAAARRHLDEVDEVLRTNIERWGQQNRPDWLRAYERANQAYAVTQRSQQLRDIIQSNSITKPLQSQTAKVLFNLGGASTLMHFPSAAGAVVPLVAGAKGIQIINRMSRSPLLRNYYLRVLASAGARNAGAMNNALERFDKEAKKLEEKQNNNKKNQ